MRLNSDSQIGQIPSNNNPLGFFSFKTNLQSFQNFPIKSAKNAQKFYSMSLSKSKKMNQNPKINIIINNNNPINYTGSSSSMYINSFNKEKSLRKNKNNEENSTFIFTGDNQSCMDDGQIIENYLRNPLENPIFECKSISTISHKEQNEIIPSQEKSFALSSSLSMNSPNTTSTIPKKKNNKNFIKMLKLLNADSLQKKEVSNNNEVSDSHREEKIKKFGKNKSSTIKWKNNKKKNICIILFLIINLSIYLNFLIIMFQPPAHKLFYDNDHIDYKYTISSLSHEKGLILNKDK